MRIRRIGFISRAYRHANRYRQILFILAKHGFAEFIDRLGIEEHIPLSKHLPFAKSDEQEDLSIAERLRLVLEELGPTFIKMGQILSTRTDLIPLEFITELSKLQDNVPPFPTAQARVIIERELKQSLDNVFQWFDETPFAAASLGQVYRARLKTGQAVIVKVQRPEIQQLIEVDLEILLYLASLAEKVIEELAVYRPTRIVEEFARALDKEMNYHLEAANLERFTRQFESNAFLRIPRFFHEASSRQVLTLEYIDGIKILELARLEHSGLDCQLIASHLADLTLDQIFKHGFFHADPHPGNILVLPENQICMLDFGMMGRVSNRVRANFTDIVLGYVQRDEVKITDAVLRIVEWEEEPDREALERDIAEFMEAHFYKPLKELRAVDIFEEMTALIMGHHLRLPADLYLVGRAMTVAGGLMLSLDPDFDIKTKFADFIKQTMLDRLKPQRMIKDILQSSGELVYLVKELPRDLRDTLRQIKGGKTRIGFEHHGLEPLIRKIDMASFQITLGLIISALFIGSSLFIVARIGPSIFGLPVLGLIGYGITGILGIFLAVARFR
ncbi:MAG: AarF/ABC1/UbiB kinase family protein [Verrucomicrobia bacterium]|nr:AarF/ABC1/UbiB kinase family protein [Verrucomicrobiota bacterium]MBU1735703.1 AarF/ABC1/UbiB kinase family protein [Verrucomicrobiota bacterium]MBU1858074.1 AarF/ABC1/UbiB kinase family protein [Verrucomicrobiota bacterium]